MRNLRLTLEYDGTAYAGWQTQAGVPTIQATVEEALGRLLKAPTRITGSGRTDAGVHALGQVANFATAARVPLKGVLHGLNALLPPDIAVRRVDEMPPDFDSRRSAVEKTYQYFLHLGPAPSAFARRTSWRVKGRFDCDAVAAGARCLVGAHDFAAFRGAGCDSRTSHRLVHDAWLAPRGEFAEFGVRGTAFLRHMVRNMVGTLVEVGLGRHPPAWVAAVLASRDRQQAGPTAPPQGLFLAAVRYDVAPLERCP